MKVRRFVASKVHGYLNLDVSFNEDLTFLTGINGSGKTTVVRGISALISPSLLALANITYDSMVVELEVDGRQIEIKAKKKDNQLVLSASGANEELVINILITAGQESYQNRRLESRPRLVLIIVHRLRIHDFRS